MAVRTAVAVLAIVVAVLYSYWQTEKIADDRLSETTVLSIVNAWDNLINSTSPVYKRVSIGINACVDLIVNAVDVFAVSDVAHPQRAIDHSVLHNLTDLAETFLYFFAKGSAAERPFANASLFRSLTYAAEQSKDYQSYIGGNAALMAQKVASLFPDIKVQLVGPVGPKLQQLLHASVDVPAASRMPDDELHLIMEYRANEHWAGRVSPVATRFITSHDVRNSNADLSDVFFAEIQKKPNAEAVATTAADASLAFEPDLVIFSGLHMLESQQDEAWLEEKVSRIAANLADVPRSLPVHLELASMVNEAFLRSIADKVFRHVSSLGLNEQELGFLVRSLKLDVDLGTDRHPALSGVVEAIKYLFRHAGGNLSRVHFHCLAYHVIAVEPSRWRNGAAAVAAGARIATTQACDADRVHYENVTLQIPQRLALSRGAVSMEFNASEPVIQWNDGEFQFSFSPVLVCRKPLKTVGLGDAISATGLLYSHYVQ